MGVGLGLALSFFIYIYIFFMRNLEIKEFSLSVFDYVSSVKQRRLNVSRQVTSFTLSVKLYVLKILYFRFIVITLKVMKVSKLNLKWFPQTVHETKPLQKRITKISQIKYNWMLFFCYKCYWSSISLFSFISLYFWLLD